MPADDRRRRRPEPHLPGRGGGPGPISLFGRTVLDGSSAITPPTELIPGYRGFIALPAVPITVSLARVAFPGDDVSLPGTVVALFSVAITFSRRHITPLRSLIPLAGSGLTTVAPAVDYPQTHNTTLAAPCTELQVSGP